MNPQQLQEKIAYYYSKLPSNVQGVFASMKWMDDLGDISRKYGLTEEQTSVLGTETTLAMLSIIDLEEYEKIVKNEITIPATSMLQMIEEIDALVLKTIRPQLTETFEKNLGDLAEEKYGGTQKLDERFAKLPQEVQVAISESGYQSKLYAIAEKHKLSINYMGALDEATTKVMLGIIHPDKYEAELQNTIAISKEEIAEIVSEVNETVLKSIREILKSHWGTEAGATQGEDDEVPIPPYALPRIEVAPKAVESSVYADSGIEIMKDEKPAEAIGPTKTEPKDERIFQQSGIKLVTDTPVPPSGNIASNSQTEKNTLAGVENPTTLSTSIIGNKLTGVTKSTETVTDHSLPKITKDVVNGAPHDPYHEPIE